MLGNPCDDGNYRYLNEGDRSKLSTSNPQDKCDATDLANHWGSWFRVSGAAGNALASKDSPPWGSCATKIRVYLKDDHPAFGDGESTRTICTATQNNNCHTQRTTAVINCGEFYLYKLEKIRECSTHVWRYCTNGVGRSHKLA